MKATGGSRVNIFDHTLRDGKAKEDQYVIILALGTLKSAAIHDRQEDQLQCRTAFML